MPRTVFVTGAGGFIGSRVVSLLRERGDAVVAMVREPERQTALHDLGVRLVEGDLGSAEAIRNGLAGSDAVIHLAGRYEIGIPAGERPAMYEANVAVTERVLDAAIAEAIPRIVQISTINVLGDSHGEVHDETFRRDLADGFMSYYDETKYLAHVAAEHRIAAGAPIVIAAPGTVYGRNDRSGFGALLKGAYDGTVRFVALGEAGVTPVHVDDVADGIVASLDRGRPGEFYLLGGENMRIRDAMAICAKAAGRRLPRLTIPMALIRLGTRIGPGRGEMLGLPPNLSEVLKTTDGVTLWATHAKATAELGFAPRALAIGAVDAFGPSTFGRGAG